MIDPDNDKQAYYTVEEVAEFFRVDKRCIAGNCLHGTINGIKIGNHWRMSIEEVLRIKERGLQSFGYIQAHRERLKNGTAKKITRRKNHPKTGNC